MGFSSHMREASDHNAGPPILPFRRPAGLTLFALSSSRARLYATTALQMQNSPFIYKLSDVLRQHNAFFQFLSFHGAFYQVRSRELACGLPGRNRCRGQIAPRRANRPIAALRCCRRAARPDTTSAFPIQTLNPKPLNPKPSKTVYWRQSFLLLPNQPSQKHGFSQAAPCCRPWFSSGND